MKDLRRRDVHEAHVGSGGPAAQILHQGGVHEEDKQWQYFGVESISLGLPVRAGLSSARIAQLFHYAMRSCEFLLTPTLRRSAGLFANTITRCKARQPSRPWLAPRAMDRPMRP